MNPATKLRMTYRFDDVGVDRGLARIEKDGQARKLSTRAFDVLVYLIEHRERIVEKQELFDEMWKEKFVTDNALTKIIKEIRQVIGDDADAPRYIETIPKRGYRFIAGVTLVEAEKPATQEVDAATLEKPAVANVELQSVVTAQQAIPSAQSATLKARLKLSGSKPLIAAIALASIAVIAFTIWKIQTRPAPTEMTTTL